MKRKTLILAGVIIGLGLCGCNAKNQNIENNTDLPEAVIQRDESTPTPEPTTEPSAEPSVDSVLSEPTGGQIEIEIFADNYKVWTKDFEDAISMGMPCGVAIVDFDRDNSLELMITSIQGTGQFSQTAVYEIAPYSNNIVNRVYFDDTKEADECGDFCSNDTFECYSKNGEYHYVVQDFSSSGYACKGMFFYDYSFGKTISSNDIGGYVLTHDDDNETTWHVSLYGEGEKQFHDADSYLKHMKDYWNGYKKEKSLKIGWVEVPKDSNCYSDLYKSYLTLATNAPEVENDYSYEIFGDDETYVIE